MESTTQQLIKNALWLDRLQPNTQIVISERLEKALEEIIKLIGETKNQRTIRKEINKILNNVFDVWDDEILKDTQRVSELAFESTAVIMSALSDVKVPKFKNIRKEVKDKLLNPNRLILGNNIDDFKNQMILGANQKLRATILKGFEDNVGIDSIRRDLTTIVGNLDRNQLKTVTRTVLLNAIDEAREESFSYFDDVVKKWQYNSTLDGRTSPYCLMAHNYITTNKSKAKYKTLSHYGCRSIWIPYFDDDEEEQIIQLNKKKVNHRDGTTSTKFKTDKVKKIPPNLSGLEAFEYFDEAYKKDYLGANRYKLYKSGKASLKEMIDISKNKFISYDELIKRLPTT